MGYTHSENFRVFDDFGFLWQKMVGVPLLPQDA